MSGMKEYKQFGCRDAGVECEFMVRAIEAEIEAIEREERQKSSKTREEQPPMAHF